MGHGYTLDELRGGRGAGVRGGAAMGHDYTLGWPCVVLVALGGGSQSRALPSITPYDRGETRGASIHHLWFLEIYLEMLGNMIA